MYSIQKTDLNQEYGFNEIVMSITSNGQFI